jgi:hypothetical protein
MFYSNEGHRVAEFTLVLSLQIFIKKCIVRVHLSSADETQGPHNHYIQVELYDWEKTGI